MSLKTRTIAIISALVLILTLIPVYALAEGIKSAATESRWAQVLSKLERVESETLKLGATGAEVVNAVYRAALSCPEVEAGSFNDISHDGFTFRVDGQGGFYSYRISTAKLGCSAVQDKDVPEYEVIYPKDLDGTRSGSSAASNVLLIGPFYGLDSSFTDQYRTEAQSIANATGGTVTVLSGYGATGTSIANGATGKAVIIMDSHGTSWASAGSSYIVLNSGTGITQTDYNNYWAFRSTNNLYGIDGRYIQHHISGSLANSFVWMAMCEGMKADGLGTTGTALLAAGAGGVYGYSQSVTFYGDYEMEATFWGRMKAGDTVAEAIQVMKDTHGLYDPYGDPNSSSSPAAYPIVMSSVDAFPANPDGPQTVHCAWKLIGSGTEPQPTIAPTLSPTASPTNAPTAVPTNTPVPTAVPDDTGWYLADSMELGGVYVITINNKAVGSTVYNTSNNHYVTAHSVTAGTEELTIPSGTDETRIAWTVVSGDQTAGFVLKNELTGLYLTLSADDYLTVGTSPLAWTYHGNNLDNQVSTDGYYYLALASSKAYFTTSTGMGNNVKLYKLNVPAPQILSGDADMDGEVTSFDALLIMRYTLGLVLGDNLTLEACDVDGDGTVGSYDALLIMRMSLGLI